MKNTYILLLLLSFQFTFSQGYYNLGENNFTLKDEKKSFFKSYYELDKKENKEDVEKDIDLSDKMPPAGDQRDKGSCWAWTTGYVMRSFIDKTDLKNGTNPNYDNIYSPEYVYQTFKGNQYNCNFGEYSKDVLAEILKNGVVKYSDFEYTDECNNYPPLSLINRAKNFIKDEYEVIVTKDLYTIKKVLNNGQPLILSIKVDDFFITKGNITKRSPYWTNLENTLESSHAMVIVGYDKNFKDFKVLNSWGKDFGDEGYVWISSDIIESQINYCCYLQKKVNYNPLKINTIKNFKLNTFSLSNQTLNEFENYIDDKTYNEFKNFKLFFDPIDNENKFAFVEIRDKSLNLEKSFTIEVGSSLTFYIQDIQYEFSYDGFIENEKIYKYKMVDKTKL